MENTNVQSSPPFLINHTCGLKNEFVELSKRNCWCTKLLTIIQARGKKE